MRRPVAARVVAFAALLHIAVRHSRGWVQRFEARPANGAASLSIPSRMAAASVSRDVARCCRQCRAAGPSCTKMVLSVDSGACALAPDGDASLVSAGSAMVLLVTGTSAENSLHDLTISSNGELSFTTSTTLTGDVSNQSKNTQASSVVYDYGAVLNKSILFYEAQRSGKLPASNRIPWRYDSAMDDRGYNGEDLTGGWYEAGHHLKLTFSQAFATSLLTWGLLYFKDAYEASGQYEHMLDCVKWPLDYFVKAHTSKFELYGQVGNSSLENAYWGRPEDMKMVRPSFRIDTAAPGSDLAASTAAALAAGYLAFKDINHTYASMLLNHSMDLYEFSTSYTGLYSAVITDPTNQNVSKGYKDEIAFAAVWLYKATGNWHYLDDATTKYYEKGTSIFGLGRNHVAYKLLLYELSNKTNTTYLQDIGAYLGLWLTDTSALIQPSGDLLLVSNFTSLGLAAQQAFVALVAADMGINVTACRNFAKMQIGYALGDAGQSFVVGFGRNPPTQPTHKAASCPWSPATCNWVTYKSNSSNPHVLDGGLVIGPNSATPYRDLRWNNDQNRVSVSGNSGFQSAVAGLLSLELREGRN